MFRKALVSALFVWVLLTAAVQGSGQLEKSLQDFAAQIYSDYAAESFEAVYAVMHPSVKALVTEDEYTAFQQRQFSRLRLSISDVEVGEVKHNPRLPASLRAILPADAKEAVYGIEISYQASFVRGMRFTQRISKTVYAATLDPHGHEPTMYLLWDPKSMEEEEQGNDSD